MPQLIEKGIIMAFVYEIVPEKDYDFFDSMNLKNPFGQDYIYVTKYSHWCADRERNIFLVPVGGKLNDTPYFIDLWLNGRIIEIEAEEYGKRINGKVIVGWKVVNIYIPYNMWDKRDSIVSVIEESLKELKQNSFEDMLKPWISCECRIADDN